MTKETGSHLFAELAGYEWASSHGDVAAGMTATLLQQVILMLAGKKKKVVPFPQPFKARHDGPSDAEVQEAVASLKAHISIPGDNR